MKLSDVKIRLIKKQDSRLKAVATLIIDDCFALHDIKLIETLDGGTMVAMPSRRTPDGEYKDIAHPINAETRQIFTDLILDAYNKALAEVVEE